MPPASSPMIVTFFSNEESTIKVSSRMAAVRGKDTKPELIVRRLAHMAGYRYRLHCRDLPGRPDIVFPSRRRVIFVHGCFWHHHTGCRRATIPQTRADYWLAKFRRNRERDRIVESRLGELGWEVLVIWECEVGNVSAVRQRLDAFLGPPGLSVRAPDE